MIKFAYTLAHRLLSLKQKSLRVANTLADSPNQFTHSKKIAKEIQENNDRSIQQ
jgi:hypothetical protein